MITDGVAGIPAMGERSPVRLELRHPRATRRGGRGLRWRSHPSDDVAGSRVLDPELRLPTLDSRLSNSMTCVLSLRLARLPIPPAALQRRGISVPLASPAGSVGGTSRRAAARPPSRSCRGSGIRREAQRAEATPSSARLKKPVTSVAVVAFGRILTRRFSLPMPLCITVHASLLRSIARVRRFRPRSGRIQRPASSDAMVRSSTRDPLLAKSGRRSARDGREISGDWRRSARQFWRLWGAR